MYNYLLLGIIQGIVEWLPVSSEGVVALFSSYFSEFNAIDTALFLHFGTMIAVLLYFRKEWISVFRGEDKELLKFLCITTIISLALGFPLYLFVREVAIGSVLLLIMGLALMTTSFLQRKEIKLDLSTNVVATIAGILQGLAVIPGLSRSGSTVFGLSFGDFTPEKILTYSYMMSVPIVFASSVYLLLFEPVIFAAWPALITSFVVGYITLGWLMKIVKKINFANFTLIFGLLCVIGSLFL